MENHIYFDLYGNPCRRLTIPVGRSVISYRATALVPDAAEDVDLDAPEMLPSELPDDVLIYTLPSRYCLPDVLGQEAWTRFGTSSPAMGACRRSVTTSTTTCEFAYGTSTARTTAADVHESRYGVCRDFTHLAVSLCRALNIPARYVFGYLPEIEVEKKLHVPMDFAAWMEVWLGNRWFTFDPRNNEHRKGRVLIGRGRDAADVAMLTTFGAPYLQSMSVIAEEATNDS